MGKACLRDPEELDGVPDLPFIICVTLDETPNLSKLPFCKDLDSLQKK